MCEVVFVYYLGNAQSESMEQWLEDCLITECSKKYRKEIQILLALILYRRNGRTGMRYTRRYRNLSFCLKNAILI